MNQLLRSLFFLLAATDADGFQTVVAPSSQRIALSPSATQLRAFKFGALPTKKAPAPAKVVPAKKAGGFTFGGRGKKAAAPAKAAAIEAPTGIQRGFSKAWNPTVVKPEDPDAIQRGFSKAWNPTVEKPEDPNKIQRGFSKAWNSR